MKCNYPNCTLLATQVPVIAIPTFRTVGLHKPHLDRDAINDAAKMKAAEFDRNLVIHQYENDVAEYNATVNNVVKTDKPTYLIGVGLCNNHVKTYKLTDWFPAKEWRLLQEAGRQKGFHVPEPWLVVIHWRPIGWRPNMGYLEIDR